MGCLFRYLDDFFLALINYPEKVINDAKEINEDINDLEIMGESLLDAFIGTLEAVLIIATGGISVLLNINPQFDIENKKGKITPKFQLDVSVKYQNIINDLVVVPKSCEQNKENQDTSLEASAENAIVNMFTRQGNDPLTQTFNAMLPHLYSEINSNKIGNYLIFMIICIKQQLKVQLQSNVEKQINNVLRKLSQIPGIKGLKVAFLIKLIVNLGAINLGDGDSSGTNVIEFDSDFGLEAYGKNFSGGLDFNVPGMDFARLV